MRMRELMESMGVELSESEVSKKIRWNDSGKNGRVLLYVDGEEVRMELIWTPGFGSDKGKYTLDIRYNWSSRKGPHSSSFYRAGSPLKAPKNVPENKVKSTLTKEVEKAIAFLRKQGKEVEVV